MAVVTKTIGPPWNIHVEQNDILTLRGAGWLMAMAEDVQEAFDLTVQAFKIAESAALPMAVGLDGFILSHSTEPIELTPQEVVDEFLPPRRTDVPMVFRPGVSITLGNLSSDNKIHARHKAAVYNAHREAKELIRRVDEEYRNLAGRSYGGLVEWYKCEDAKYVVVCTEAWCSNGKNAVDKLRTREIPVGLMRLRFLRPFPTEFVKYLDQYDTVIVYDRD